LEVILLYGRRLSWERIYEEGFLHAVVIELWSASCPSLAIARGEVVFWIFA
jgi:hypothetical protein